MDVSRARAACTGVYLAVVTGHDREGLRYVDSSRFRGIR